MFRDFLVSHGKVEWRTLSDTVADATFSHPDGGTVRISWDMDRAKAAGLSGKDNWKKFPRQMLRARLLSEGIRTVYPMATSGMYVPEEVQDFDEKPAKAVPKTIEAKATVVDDAKKTASEKDTHTAFAKQYAVEIELADTSDKLETLVKRNAQDMANLAAALPTWHKRIVELLDKQRASFKEPATLGEILDEGRAA